MREHEAFEASGVLPAWEQERAVLDAERLGLHAGRMGLSTPTRRPATSSSCSDDQKVDGSAEKLGTAAAAGPPTSTDRPALRPPSTGTTPAARAAGSSSPIAPTTGGVGR